MQMRNEKNFRERVHVYNFRRVESFLYIIKPTTANNAREPGTMPHRIYGVTRSLTDFFWLVTFVVIETSY